MCAVYQGKVWLLHKNAVLVFGCLVDAIMKAEHVQTQHKQNK